MTAPGKRFQTARELGRPVPEPRVAWCMPNQLINPMTDNMGREHRFTCRQKELTASIPSWIGIRAGEWDSTCWAMAFHSTSISGPGKTNSSRQVWTIAQSCRTRIQQSVSYITDNRGLFLFCAVLRCSANRITSELEGVFPIYRYRRHGVSPVIF